MFVRWPYLLVRGHYRRVAGVWRYIQAYVRRYPYTARWAPHPHLRYRLK